MGLADLCVYTGERVVAGAERHCCLCDAAEHASIVQGQSFFPSIACPSTELSWTASVEERKVNL